MPLSPMSEAKERGLPLWSSGVPISGALVPVAGPRSSAAATWNDANRATIAVANNVRMEISIVVGSRETVPFHCRNQGQIAQNSMLRIVACREPGLQGEQSGAEPRLAPEPFLASLRGAGVGEGRCGFKVIGFEIVDRLLERLRLRQIARQCLVHQRTGRTHVEARDADGGARERGDGPIVPGRQPIDLRGE